jgi:hypothetical protein
MGLFNNCVTQLNRGHYTMRTIGHDAQDFLCAGCGGAQNITFRTAGATLNLGRGDGGRVQLTRTQEVEGGEVGMNVNLAIFTGLAGEPLVALKDCVGVVDWLWSSVPPDKCYNRKRRASGEPIKLL